MQKHLNFLLTKEMSRKEFLKTVGLAMASLVGLSTFLRLVGHQHQNNHGSANGYGSSAYGGKNH